MRYFPSLVDKDKEGKIRIIRKEDMYKDIVDACFDQLRWYAKKNIFVSVEMLTAISKALEQAREEEMKIALVKKAAAILELLKMEKIPATDLQKAEALYNEMITFNNGGAMTGYRQ